MGIRKDIQQHFKKILKKNNRFSALAGGLYTNILGRNRIRGRRNNKILCRKSFLKDCDIKITGRHNLICIKRHCVLKECRIHIHGNYNKIILGNQVSASRCNIYVENDENLIYIGEKTHINGPTHLACMEGCNIVIGERCLFSSEVTLRTGDSHSILSSKGNRINPSRSIRIGCHVWIGNRTILTKGAEVATNSIVATGAIVTGKFVKPGCIIGGIPAKVIKENVNWDEKRL
ncbi:acyltransferase [Mobilitalea sibirica]|uniref:Acyltransferase n=1 Tax=Mobilitalea sibirica TaxID=1462919 RepID=A0A8J7GWV7_9FIRM|nr:acyltransferase [Mobilitalea sibirica]MBH1939414.1 acyltransferase [Mobilitalea sibirica]